MYRSRLFATVLLLVLLFLPGSYAQLQSVGGGVSDEVRAFTFNADSSALIAVGKFVYTRADSLRANGVAQWNGVSWDVGPFAGGNGDTTINGNPNPCLSVALYQDTLFVSYLGNFWQYDTNNFTAVYLAGGQWHSAFAPNGLSWFMPEQGRLFASTEGDTVNGQFLPGVFEWKNGGPHPLPNSPFMYPAEITTSTYWQNKYWFGGSFQTMGSSHVIGFDGDSTWYPTDTLSAWCLRAIEGYGDSLYAGGYIAGPNALSKHMVIWDGAEWKPFFSEVEYIGQVFDIENFGGYIYFSGGFRFVGDTVEYGLLRYDGQNLCALGGEMIGVVGRLAFFDDHIYMTMNPQQPQVLGEYIARLSLDSLVPDTCLLVSTSSVGEASVGHSGLAIYPNPTAGTVTVNCPHGCSESDIAIYNGLGRMVLVERAVRSEHLMDVSGFSQGIYLLSVVDQKGVRHTERLLIE